MANIAKLDNLSIDDLASLWGVDKADITKVIGLDVGVSGDLSIGTKETFNSGNTGYNSVAAMDATHAIVTYKDDSDNYKGKAVCLTLSGTTITVGSVTQFTSKRIWTKPSVVKMDSTHALVAWRNHDSDGGGDVCCLTLSGTTITAGSITTFHGSRARTPELAALNSNQAIVVYGRRDPGDAASACYLTLSGTSVSVEDKITFDTGLEYDFSHTTMDSTHTIVTFRPRGGGAARAVCLTLSGASISYGSKITFESGTIRYTSITAMDANHAIVTYSDGDDSNKGKAICLTLFGTTISAESPIIFNSGATYWTSATAMDSTHAVVSYQDDDDNSKGKAICLTLSGTTINTGSPITFESGNTNYTSITTTDTTHAVVTYRDQDDGDKGKTVCITLS